MADKSIISNAKLDAIVAAIVAKGGGTAPMTADQMATAIANIPSGGGDVTALIEGSIQDLTDTDATVVRKHFLRDSGIKSVSMPNVTRIRDDAFNLCTKLESIDFPACTEIDNRAFSWCTKLSEITFPTLLYCYRNAFEYCRDRLARVDLGTCQHLGSNAFIGCSYLVTLILRGTTQVCNLEATDCFDSTPIKTGTGYIYVPDALVANYKAATNWSTFANQIKGLSELPTT